MSNPNNQRGVVLNFGFRILITQEGRGGQPNSIHPQ